jgi:hypothetical protein
MSDSRTSNPLRMDAYYYHFADTGVPEIDLILSAIACAGKAYHHTEMWNEECEWTPHEGNSPVDWIQNAAVKAAAALRNARAADEPSAKEKAFRAALGDSVYDTFHSRPVQPPETECDHSPSVLVGGKCVFCPTEPPRVESFQDRVRPWLDECFGEEVARNTVERNHRFLEEALELVQSLGCTWEDARKLVDYVFSRDVGEPNQELGGVMVTLAALSLANSLSMNAAAETELARVWQKIDVIRAKQARKVKDSALPGSTVTKKTEPSSAAVFFDRTEEFKEDPEV